MLKVPVFKNLLLSLKFFMTDSELVPRGKGEKVL